MTREKAIERNLCLLEYMKINNKFHPKTPFLEDNFVALKMAIKALEQEPKTGHWIWKTEDVYKCSECGEDIHVKEVMNKPQYICCPMCMARMVGDTDEVSS